LRKKERNGDKSGKTKKKAVFPEEKGRAEGRGFWGEKEGRGRGGVGCENFLGRRCRKKGGVNFKGKGKGKTNSPGKRWSFLKGILEEGRIFFDSSENQNSVRRAG